jgi:hypothetical protein
MNCETFVKKPVFQSEEEKQKENITSMYNYYNMLLMN